MVLRQVLLGLAFVQCGVQAGRGRGSPSTTTPAPPPLPGPVDLTLALERNASSTDHPFSVSKNTSAWGEFGWSSTQSTCSSGQAGTHIEAPFHLNERGWKVDEVPLDRLLVSAVLLDVSADAARNASFALSAEHLVAWEKKHGLLPPNSVLLINFGWGASARGRHATTPAPQPATTTSPTYHAPVQGLTADAASHLVAQARVVGVGVDLPALDASPSSTTGRGRGEPAARTLMAANIYTLLNLDLSRELPAKGFSLLVMPSKVRGAAVAAARVVATTRSPSPSRSAADPTAGSLVLCVTAAAALGAHRVFVV
ncbi:kynurenine formamidase-like [Frankliniella occidentalis]|uniref:Kynurenine formamidase-like n=1 Tax=Frankliniella occidentalis TaxID=133901 RepID=A0A6J1S877_FRAOC|nr:kynurenine formamidase-like [Frankliniella occidentalis]XP_052132987.1 kynurenine formamidase-like [Frankliniella occidentalis]